MLTRIDVVADPVRDRCVLRTGNLSPRRLPAPYGVVRVALVAAGALLLAGDDVRLQVVASGKVKLEIVEIAGAVAYAMRGGSARWEVDIALTDGAELSWHGEPFVVAEGADVERSSSITLDEGCRATLRESLVLGRHGEAGGRLRTRTRAFLSGGADPASSSLANSGPGSSSPSELLVEDLDLAPGVRSGWAVLGEARCLDSITTLGHRLPEAPQTLQLEGPGSIARRLVGEQHASDLGKLWADLHHSPTPVGSG
ncbi:urease accessory protein UreD [Kribbella italica]|uniref:Urease accessory protein n=1 Tax=Kribbella italica TaxID=1540520 RepID=A0A7W9J7N7_9ACTN|nr:urease accessory protein UreD [Kribbella italica]MBB5837154.1 urease accessory protein [Kribbella italica]